MAGDELSLAGLTLRAGASVLMVSGITWAVVAANARRRASADAAHNRSIAAAPASHQQVRAGARETLHVALRDSTAAEAGTYRVASRVAALRPSVLSAGGLLLQVSAREAAEGLGVAQGATRAQLSNALDAQMTELTALAAKWMELIRHVELLDTRGPSTMGAVEEAREAIDELRRHIDEVDRRRTDVLVKDNEALLAAIAAVQATPQWKEPATATADAEPHDASQSSPDDRTCRWCYGEATVLAPGARGCSGEGELVSPCGCVGTQAYVHLQCLYEWQVCVP